MVHTSWHGVATLQLELDAGRSRRHLESRARVCAMPMLVYEHTVVEQESELEWEVLVTSTTAVDSESGAGVAPLMGNPMGVPMGVPSGVPMMAPTPPGGWGVPSMLPPPPPPPPPQQGGGGFSAPGGGWGAPPPGAQGGGDAGGAENQAGKLFLGGIAWTTDENALSQYFGQFGELQHVEVMRNKQTGQSRGFGFVTYAHVDGARRVLGRGDHFLEGRRVDVKSAMPQGMAPAPLVNTAEGPIDGRGPPPLSMDAPGAGQMVPMGHSPMGRSAPPQAPGMMPAAGGMGGFVPPSVGINRRSTAGPGYLRTPLPRSNRIRFP